MSLPLNTDGRVLNGGYPEMRVRVEEDPQSTSGYLIYRWWRGSNGLGPNSSHEDRVESMKLVEQYFAGRDWKIVWGPEAGPAAGRE